MKQLLYKFMKQKKATLQALWEGFRGNRSRKKQRCKHCGKVLGVIEVNYYGLICETCERAY